MKFLLVSKSYFLSIIMMVVLVACNNAGNNSNLKHLDVTSDKGKHLKDSTTWIAVRPGLGFNSKTDTFADKICYKPSGSNGVVYGGAEGNATFGAALRTSDIITVRSNTLKTEFKNKTYYTDNELSYLYNNQETGLDMYYYFYAHHTRMISVKYATGTDILSDVGMKIYEKNKNNPLEFKRLCGDTLVNQYREGSSLIIRAKLKFNSYMQKNEFNARLKAGYSNKAPEPLPWNPLAVAEISSGTFDNTLKLAATEAGIDLQINMSAMQTGGEPGQLSAAVTTPTANCSTENIYNCDMLFNGVSQYANSYGVQFNPRRDDSGYEDAKMNFDGFMSLGENIDSQLHFDSTGSTNSNMRNNRAFLGYKYDEIIYYKNKLLTLVSMYPVPLSFDYAKSLNEMIDKLNTTETSLRNLHDIQDCWRDGEEEKCNSIVKKIRSDPNLNIDLPTPTNSSLVSQIQSINELLVPIFYAEKLNTTFYPTNKRLDGGELVEFAVPTLAEKFIGEANHAHIVDVSEYIKENNSKHIDGVIKGRYKDDRGNDGDYSLLLYLHQSPQRALMRIFINGSVVKDWTELHTIKNPFYIDEYKEMN